jgi:hypothetical protein
MSMRLPSADELEQLEDIGKRNEIAEKKIENSDFFFFAYNYRKAMGCQGKKKKKVLAIYGAICMLT